MINMREFTNHNELLHRLDVIVNFNDILKVVTPLVEVYSIADLEEIINEIYDQIAMAKESED